MYLLDIPEIFIQILYQLDFKDTISMFLCCRRSHSYNNGYVWAHKGQKYGLSIEDFHMLVTDTCLSPAKLYPRIERLYPIDKRDPVYAFMGNKETDLMIMFKFFNPALPCGGQINEHYDNFLELAATYNNINIVKHLTHRYNLRLKADCLSTIILYGHSDIIKYFVDRLGYSVHSIPNALRQSFYSRNTDMFKYILSKSDYDDGLLNLACISGYVEAVRILLADPRCDPNANDKEAYYSAIDYDYREIVNLFEMCPRFNRYIN